MTNTISSMAISLFPMTPGLFGGVTGSRAVMGAHICTALCDVTPNMRWTSKAKETQHYERLSPHSAQLYHQETH